MFTILCILRKIKLIVFYVPQASIDNEKPATNINIRRSNNRLELTGELYVGGVPHNMYDELPTLVSSRSSFAGCLGTILINGRLNNIFTDTLTTNRYVTAGCTGMSCCIWTLFYFYLLKMLYFV